MKMNLEGVLAQIHMGDIFGNNVTRERIRREKLKMTENDMIEKLFSGDSTEWQQVVKSPGILFSNLSNSRVLVGVSLLSVGIIYKITLEELSTAIPIEYRGIVVIPVLTIPLGTILIAIAVFGCYGCLTERINFVALYTVVLFVIFALQVTTGICSLVQLKDEEIFQEDLNLHLNGLFKKYHIKHGEREVVDLIQHRLKCCGFNGLKDWDSVPRSCYKTDTREVFEASCPSQVFNFLRNCMFVIGTSVIALSLTEIAALAISAFFLCYLMRQMDIRSKEYVCTKVHHSDPDHDL